MVYKCFWIALKSVSSHFLRVEVLLCLKSLNAFQNLITFGFHHGINTIAIGQNSLPCHFFLCLMEYLETHVQCLNILNSNFLSHSQLFFSDQLITTEILEIFFNMFCSILFFPDWRVRINKKYSFALRIPK